MEQAAERMNKAKTKIKDQIIEEDN